MDQPDPSLAALEAAVLADVRRERGWVAALRARSRGVRVGLVVGLVVAEALVMALFFRRIDWGSYPGWRMGLAVAGLAATAVVLAGLALRPLWRAPLPRWVERLAIGAALAVPLVIAALPPLPTVPRFADAGAGFAARCFFIGGALAAAVIFVAGIVDRAALAGRFGRLAAAVTGGAAGVLALQLECPINDRAHLLCGHALVPIVVAALAALLPRGR